LLELASILSLFSLPLVLGYASSTSGEVDEEEAGTTISLIDGTDVSTSLAMSAGGVNGNDDEDALNTDALRVEEEELKISALESSITDDITEDSTEIPPTDSPTAPTSAALLPRLRIPLARPTAAQVQSVPPGVYCFQ
jgi:hypothetical protein